MRQNRVWLSRMAQLPAATRANSLERSDVLDKVVSEDMRVGVETGLKWVADYSTCKWFTSWQELNITTARLVGQGTFALVEKGLMRTQEGGKAIVAIKRLKPGLPQHAKYMELFLQEINTLSQLNHGSVVAYVGAGLGLKGPCSSQPYLLLEYMDAGSLKCAIGKCMRSEYPAYKKTDAGRWMMQIANALAYLHNHKPMVIHRDVKTENVLLKGSKYGKAEAKLADFGLHTIRAADDVSNQLSRDGFQLAREPSHRVLQHAEGSGQTGSYLYMAPEVFLSAPYDEKVDIFSLGVIMYETFSGVLLVAQFTSTQEIEQYAARVSCGHRPTLPPTWPREVAGLVHSCWSQAAHQRPAAAHVALTLQHLLDTGLLAAMQASGRGGAGAPQCCVIS